MKTKIDRMRKQQHKKVIFELEPDWHGFETESVWIKERSARSYQIENTPFFIFGVSYKDIVEAEENDYGSLIFKKVLKISGHSTYRAIITPEMGESWRDQWAKLFDLGCTYEEGMVGEVKVLAIDVPPETDIYTVYSLLEEGEAAGCWAFEEGHVGHKLAS